VADKGQSPASLIIKRIEVDIMRFQAQVMQQELQILELEEQKQRLAVNIEGTKEAIVKKQEDLRLTKEQHGVQ